MAELGIANLDDGSFEVFAETKAWNFQQGSMLQWWSAEPEGTVLYNTRCEDRFGCRLQKIDSGTTRDLPQPVAAVSHDGRYALSLNFSRLADERPGYGYEGVPDPWANEFASAEDGIRLLNMDTGKHELIISLAKMAAFQPDDTMVGAKHWFNHLLFSPDDKRFIFLHRWRRKGGNMDDAMVGAARHYTRMFTANPDGSDIYCLNPPDMTPEARAP